MLAATALRLAARALRSPLGALWALFFALAPPLTQAISPTGSQLFAPERQALTTLASLAGSGIGIGYLSKRKQFLERLGEVERVSIQALVLLGTSSIMILSAMIGVAGTGEASWNASSLLIAYRAPAMALGILALPMNSTGLLCLLVAGGWVAPSLIPAHSWLVIDPGGDSTVQATTARTLLEGLLTAATLSLGLLTNRVLSRKA